jgi:hypothetical protein
MSNTIREMMDILLAALVVSLREAGGEEVCSTAIYPGDSVALDYAECGGMAWVRLATANPSRVFPTPVNDLSACASSLAYTVEMGVMRSAPLATALLADAGVDLPDDSENTASAYEVLDDVDAMYKAIQMAARDIEYLIPGSYTPVGPVGGAVGGTWSLTVGDDE